LIGGGFNEVLVNGSSVSCGNVITWDGSNVNTLQGGTNGEVEGITPYQGNVLVGGGFTTAGGTPTAGLAIWNGVNSVGKNEAQPLSVYPNPATNELLVESGGATVPFQLFSLKGELLREGLARNARIDISSIAAGVYILELPAKRIRVVFQ